MMGEDAASTIVRRVRPADAAAIAAIYAPIVERSIISFEENPPTAADIRDRIEAAGETWPWLVAAAEDGVLGYVYASEHRKRAAYRWSVDVTAYVREDARGRGIGGDLYRVLFRVLELQGFHRAFAGITLPNDASVALHRSVGFEPVGVYREVGFKLGAWRDVSWWQRSIGRADPPSHDPLLLSEIAPERLRQAGVAG
jgi:L-amino acid N-acyltransferase YncA